MQDILIQEIEVADDGDRWRELGLTVKDKRCQLGAVSLRFISTQETEGITGWSLLGLTSGDLDGLPTTACDADIPLVAPTTHPNGITRIDHIVAVSPDLDRSVKALREAGLDLRRIREDPTPAGSPRQAFFRLGEEILEVSQEPPDIVKRSGCGRRLRFWGLALEVDDLDATVRSLGDRVGAIRPAVQPGRRIATVRREASIAIPLALISSP